VIIPLNLDVDVYPVSSDFSVSGRSSFRAACGNRWAEADTSEEALALLVKRIIRQVNEYLCVSE